MENDDSPKRPNKRKISEYFGKKEEPEDKKKKIDSSEEAKNEPVQSTNSEEDVDVQSLKCPKKKVLIEVQSDGIVAEKVEPPKKKTKRTKMIELGKSQRVLDAGQAKIGNTTCELCGMIYCVDEVQDVKLHDTFHQQFLHRFEIPMMLVTTFLILHSREHGEYKVYYIPSMAPDAFKTAMRVHMAVINTELGYTSTEDLFTDENRIFLVLLVENNRVYIGGVCVAVKIHKAWTDTTRKEISDNGAVDDWIVGIDRIWVTSRLRKKGVAYALLDAATTQDRTMEHRARRLRIAFSDPTDDGKVLAQRFTQTRYQPEDQFGGEILLY